MIEWIKYRVFNWYAKRVARKYYGKFGELIPTCVYHDGHYKVHIESLVQGVGWYGWVTVNTPEEGLGMLKKMYDVAKMRKAQWIASGSTEVIQ